MTAFIGPGGAASARPKATPAPSETSVDTPPATGDDGITVAW